MVGLVFAEPLRLTLTQWLALEFNTAAWLWWYFLERGHPVRIPPLRGGGGCFPLLGGARGGFMLTAILTFTALWSVFWNTPTSIDQQMLFEQARYLSRLRGRIFWRNWRIVRMWSTSRPF